MAKTKRFLEFLKEEEPDELIYVGTQGGSGWLLIETAQTLIDNLDKIEDRLHKRSEYVLRDAKQRIKSLPFKIVEAQQELDKLKKSNDATEDDIKKAESRLFAAERSFVTSYGIRKRYTTYLNKWVHVSKREVLESYPHTVNDPGVSVIITGIEQGDLWFKDEKGRNKLI